MAKFISFRDFDWLLLVVVLLICSVGVMQIYSATYMTKFAGVHLKQIYWILAGIGLMFLVSVVSYEAILDNIHWIYLAAMGSLGAVLVFGVKVLGARRWIRMPGGSHFQPSEWVKLILILAIARYFQDLRQRDDLSLGDLFKAGLIVLVPFALVMKQPDLGTALTFLPPLIVGLFLGGIRWKHALIIVLVFAAAAPLAYHKMKPYQRQRLVAFIHPEDDPQGAGYQVEQAKIAVGAGG